MNDENDDVIDTEVQSNHLEDDDKIEVLDKLNIVNYGVDENENSAKWRFTRRTS